MSLLLLFANAALSGGVVPPSPPPPSMAPATQWDPIAAIDTLAPGVVLQRSILDAVVAAWIANNYQPLTQAQIIAITGPLPPFLTSIKWIRDV